MHRIFSKTFHPTVNEYLTLFRAREGEGSEGWERCLTSVTLGQVHVGSLAATSPHGYLGYENSLFRGSKS